MLPTWIIVEVERERRRREREAEERRPTLHVDLPPVRPEPERAPSPRETVVVIDFG